MIPKQYHMDYAEAELLSPAYAQASLAIQRQWLARYQKNDTELNDEQLRLASNQHNQKASQYGALKYTDCFDHLFICNFGI